MDVGKGLTGDRGDRPGEPPRFPKAVHDLWPFLPRQPQVHSTEFSFAVLVPRSVPHAGPRPSLVGSRGRFRAHKE